MREKTLCAAFLLALAYIVFVAMGGRRLLVEQLSPLVDLLNLFASLPTR